MCSLNRTGGIGLSPFFKTSMLLLIQMLTVFKPRDECQLFESRPNKSIDKAKTHRLWTYWNPSLMYNVTFYLTSLRLQYWRTQLMTFNQKTNNHWHIFISRCLACQTVRPRYFLLTIEFLIIWIKTFCGNVSGQTVCIFHFPAMVLVIELKFWKARYVGFDFAVDNDRRSGFDVRYIHKSRIFKDPA